MRSSDQPHLPSHPHHSPPSDCTEARLDPVYLRRTGISSRRRASFLFTSGRTQPAAHLPELNRPSAPLLEINLQSHSLAVVLPLEEPLQRFHPASNSLGLSKGVSSSLLRSRHLWPTLVLSQPPDRHRPTHDEGPFLPPAFFPSDCLMVFDENSACCMVGLTVWKADPEPADPWLDGVLPGLQVPQEGAPLLLPHP